MSYSDNISLEEEIQSLNTLQDETAQLFNHADEGQEAVTQLTDIKSAIENTSDKLEGVALEMYNLYTNSIYDKLGIVNKGISLESNNEHNKKIAIEGIGEKVRDIIKAIWQFIVNAFKKARNFVLGLFGFNKNLEQKAKKIEEEAKEKKSAGFTPDVEDFIFTPQGAPDSYTNNKSADTDDSDGTSSKKYSNEHSSASAKQTEEARKKEEVIKAVRENIRQHAAAHKAKNQKEQEENSKIKATIHEFEKRKLVSVKTNISDLLMGIEKVIKPAELINRLENLYNLTEEIIKYNNNIYVFWMKYTDLILKENGDTFFSSFMSKQQETFYSELKQPSSFKPVPVDKSDDHDHREEFISKSESYPLSMSVIISVPKFVPIMNGGIIKKDIHQWTNNLTLASACHVETNVIAYKGEVRDIPVLTLEEIEKISGLVSKISNMLFRTENYLVTKLEYFENASEQLPSVYDKFMTSKTFSENPNGYRLLQFVSHCSSGLSKVISTDIVRFFSEVTKITKDCLQYCEISKNVYTESSASLQKKADQL